MVRLIMGMKGSGKTKQLIELINNAAKDGPFPGSTSGLHAGNYDISHMFIDNFCKIVGREVDGETENFLNWLDSFGERNNIKFTVTISADPSGATDGMQRFL